MIFEILSGGNIRDIFISLLMTLPAILIALTFHEAAHGFVAYKMGDRTAYNLGRVTLNPIKHLDPMGFLWMLIFGYGWAKPVPINARNFRNPKKGMALTAIAGPLTNLILGVISSVILAVMIFYSSLNYSVLLQNATLYAIINSATLFFEYMAFLNFMLMAYNLIPIPPFDGSRFFGYFLPSKIYWKIMQYEQYTLIIIVALSFISSRFFGFSPFSWVASKMLGNIVNFILDILFKVKFGF
jgi:Zn-dependent protease